jgi:hypothetical protein
MGEWLSSPEGQQGSSQARSAWVAMPKAPVREGLVEVVTLLAIASNLSQVRLNRPAGTGLFFLIIPGTSCLATTCYPSGTKAIQDSTRYKPMLLYAVAKSWRVRESACGRVFHTSRASPESKVA